MKTVVQRMLLVSAGFVALLPLIAPATYYKQDSVVYKSGAEHKVCSSIIKSGAHVKPSPVSRTEPSNRPNVLLIGIESLRADHLSCLGYPRNTTPTLDKLARKGALFSGAIATSSWTIPTNMSVFTSLYPGMHKTTDFHKKLPDQITTLAEILRENGYLTAAFVSNPILDRRYGFSRGFDIYDDFSVQLEVGLGIFDGNDKTSADVLPSAMTNEAVHRAATAWLRGNHHNPFLMFVFYFDPHFDYVPPPPFDTIFDPNYEGSTDGRGIAFEPRKSTRPSQADLEHIVSLYDGEILYTDGYIANLMERFREYGILDQTFVIVFGDHGDEFYEHGSTTHGHTLYNELIHIPLILTLAGLIPENRRIDSLVSQVDIMPTILDYLGIEYPGLMQGSSLRPLIERRKDVLHNIVYAELNLNSRVFSAAVGKDNKFILDLNTGAKQLFDLNNDPAEQFNIHKGQVTADFIPLESCLTAWLANNDKLTKKLYSGPDTTNVTLDKNQLLKLKALGYLQ